MVVGLPELAGEGTVEEELKAGRISELPVGLIGDRRRGKSGSHVVPFEFCSHGPGLGELPSDFQKSRIS